MSSPQRPSNRLRMPLSRRTFLSGASALTALSASIGVAEWLQLFRRQGVPGTPGQWRLAQARAADDSSTGGAEEPRFLIYWFLEGGWDAYSCLSPVDTPNHSSIVVSAGELNPTPSWSDQFYRVKGYGATPYPLATDTQGMRIGYLAVPGAALLPDACVISSHYGSTFHSGSRFDFHYGKYSRSLSEARQSDERTVLQAFCEAKGSGFLLPHISWHRWLADGELALSNYPEGTGYYEKLGPSYAHTVYGKTPEYFRQRLLSLGDLATSTRRAMIRGYTDNLHDNFLNGKDGATVRAFSSALEIYRSMVEGELTVDPTTLFTDPTLRAEFNIQPGDESPTETSVNGNPARSKESPHVRVQAMMAYECMRASLGCGFWIESRDVRCFDSHRSRKTVLDTDSNSDQLAKIKTELWEPLQALVNRLKSTETPGLPGRSLWDQTTLVVTSEMGRTIMGDVTDIVSSEGTPDELYTKVLEQDVCQHWPVNSVMFLGGRVQKGLQVGRVGAQTLDAIPIMPDGRLDPAFDPQSGLLVGTESASSFVPDAGHVYATALALSGVDPAGKGRNERPALSFVQASS